MGRCHRSTPQSRWFATAAPPRNQLVRQRGHYCPASTNLRPPVRRRQARRVTKYRGRADKSRDDRRNSSTKPPFRKSRSSQSRPCTHRTRSPWRQRPPIAAQITLIRRLISGSGNRRWAVPGKYERPTERKIQPGSPGARRATAALHRLKTCVRNLYTFFGQPRRVVGVVRQTSRLK